MSQQNRTTLKNYFRTGSRPTQEQFADLIDSSLNLANNELFEAGGNLGLGHDQPAARLSVNGNLNVSPNNNLGSRSWVVCAWKRRDRRRVYQPNGTTGGKRWCIYRSYREQGSRAKRPAG